MALEAEHPSSSNALDIQPERETIDISIGLDTRLKGRKRANSKIYGNGSSEVNQDINTLGIDQSLIQYKQVNNNIPNFLNERNKFVYILVLRSFNDTFDRKTLAIPTYPQVLKLGRPNTSQRVPTSRNGYFDSRVISREHAQLTVKDGKIYIDDLNSANGTFLNGVKILKEHEVKKNDKIELGINIENDGNKILQHRRISCEASEILIWPIDSESDKPKVLGEVEKLLDSYPVGEQKKNLEGFDSAMFGDITEDLDDVALGVSHDFLSGIFVNNNIGTNDNLIKSIRGLINQVHVERVNSLKLASVDQMLTEFKNQLMNNDDHLMFQNYKKENEKLRNEIEQLKRELKDVSELNNKNLRSANDRNGTIIKLNGEIKLLKDGLKIEQETNSRLTNEFKELEHVLDEKKIESEKVNLEVTDHEEKLKQEIDQLKSVIKKKDLLIEQSKILANKSNNIIVNDIIQMSLVILGISIIGVGYLKWSS